MILEKVIGILAEELDLDTEEIKAESSLQEDLGADSLDVVEIVMALEDEFDIEIPDEETGNIKRVQDIVNYIESKK